MYNSIDNNFKRFFSFFDREFTVKKSAKNR